MAQQSKSGMVIVLGVVCGLVAVAAGLRSLTKGPSPVAQQAVQNLEQYQRQTTAELRKELNEGGIDGMKANDRAREGLAKAKAAADAMGGAEGEMLRLSMGVMSELNDQNAAYTKRAHDLTEAGGLTPQNLTTAAKLDASLGELERLIAESKQLEARVSAIPERIQEAINKSGADRQTIDTFLRGAKFDQRVPLMLEANQCDTTIWESFKIILGLQKRELGRWKAAGENTTFENAEAQKAYDQALQAIRAAANKQVESQRKLLELGS